MRSRRRESRKQLWLRPAKDDTQAGLCKRKRGVRTSFGPYAPAWCWEQNLSVQSSSGAQQTLAPAFRRDITADTALRLAHFFGTSAEFWINLQGLYDLRIAQQEAGKTIKALPTLKRMTAVQA